MYQKIRPEALRKSPADKRLIAEVIADRASKWDFGKRLVWSAFRDLNEEDLLDVYYTHDDIDFYVKVTKVYNERL